MNNVDVDYRKRIREASTLLGLNVIVSQMQHDYLNDILSSAFYFSLLDMIKRRKEGLKKGFKRR